ncbi:MAG TPA: hypothetical protein DEF34_02655 [Desulfotomaculum sp.]|nr:MAG: hypothetical protein VR67_09360 [Peptococcaceae bacterium BRH_c8a]KJS71252.1 MAG: hypothetical protein JL56_15375 [Desulfotomaculum sp. BICA1-6]HBX22528.1 hypothetical protein [Desulfotomaculum sp.]
MENGELNRDPKYMLAALIEIYRGMNVYLPEFDQQMERQILRDIFSAAISFARFDETRHLLSEEINHNLNQGSSVKQQVELTRTQSPDLLNAKMVAAAHLIKVMEENQTKFS